MKKFGVAFTSLLVLSVFLIVGCGSPAPSKSPEQTIKDGITKLSEVTSYNYNVGLVGDITDESNENGKFNLNLSGAIDVKDTLDPKLSLKIDGSLNMTDAKAGGSATAEIMMDKNAVYAEVSKFDLKSGEAVPQDIMNMFGKWWKVELPEGALKEFSLSMPQGNDANLTPEQKQLKEAFENAKIFSNPKYVAAEDVMGESSYKYQVTLDKQGFVDFVKKTAEIQKQEVTADEIQKLQDGLNNVDVTGYIWVGTKSGVANQFSGTVTFKGGTDTPKGTIDVKVSIGKINEPVTLNIPANVERFPIEAFSALLMPQADSSSLSDTTTETPVTDTSSIAE